MRWLHATQSNSNKDTELSSQQPVFPEIREGRMHWPWRGDLGKHHNTHYSPSLAPLRSTGFLSQFLPLGNSLSRFWLILFPGGLSERTEDEPSHYSCNWTRSCNWQSPFIFYHPFEILSLSTSISDDLGNFPGMVTQDIILGHHAFPRPWLIYLSIYCYSWGGSTKPCLPSAHCLPAALPSLDDQGQLLLLIW